MIPQTNPQASYIAHKAEIDTAIARVLDSGWYILGQEVTAFEQEFAAYLGLLGAVAVANGTDAIELALRALDIGPGDTVATVSHTAVATIAAIELTGATPVLLDIEPATFVLNPAHLDRAAHEIANLRAVIPVHLYGHPVDMPAIMDIARTHGLKVVEDCSQAHGSHLGHRKVGTWGDLAAFSLYPTKNLGAIGDGGIVTANQPEMLERLRGLREYGWKDRYISSELGKNSRLDELQAAILRVKLKFLDADNAQRRLIAARYDAALADSGLQRPEVRPQVESAYHQYVIRTPNRDLCRKFLRERGIGTLVHYPVPVHLQPAYRHRVLVGGSGLLETEKAAGQILSLPMYPQLNSESIEATITALLEWSETQGFSEQ